MYLDRLDLVVVTLGNGANYLFRAPAWSSLEEGDEVVVETARGNQRGTVVGSITTCSDLHGEDAELMIKVLHATLPLKRVLSKVIEREFQYDDEDTTDEQTEQTEKQEA